MNIKKSKFILSSFIILSSALATSNTSLADDLEYQDKVSEVYEKYSESIEKSNNQNDKTTESSDELNTVKKDELDGSKENPVIKNENASNESNSNKELEKKDNLSKEPNIENDGTLNEEKNKILDKNNQSNTNQNSFTNDESSNNQLEISSEIKNVNVKSPSNTKNIQINTLSNKNNYINSYNTKEEFLKMLDSHSDLAMHYNIFPEVMMGQAILESGWGQSRLSKQSKNIFGVKVPYNEIGQGKGDLYDTKEFIDGKYVTVKAEFRRFNTYEESLRQYLSLLNGNHYNKFKVNKATNYKDQLARIKNAGYATDPNYVNSVLNVIEKNILPKYAYNKVLTANYSDTKVSYPKNSWVNKNGNRYFSDSNGNLIKGIYNIGINKYYFANDGKLKTDTKVITNKGAYIIGSNGIMSPVVNRWIQVNSNSYHTDSKGLLNKGLFLIENRHYSFDLISGKLDKNKIHRSNNYLFASDSKGVVNRRKSTKTVLGNYEYTTDSNGKIIKTRDLTKKPDPTIVTSYISKGKAYNKLSDNSVKVAKSSWVKVGGKDFRTNSIGQVLYGIHKIGNYYYHLTYNGISKGYKVYVNKHLYSFDNTGKGYLVSSNYTPVRDLDVAIGWMKQAMNFHYQYSMHWQKRNQIGYADCSSAVYRAMKHGGFISKNIANGNTETLFELGRRGQILKQISENQIRYGDIFVAGVPGKSLGAGGHTGFILDKNTIIHCNYADYGVSITQRKGRMGDKKYPVRYYRLVGAR